jgi:hypothetical protein
MCRLRPEASRQAAGGREEEVGNLIRLGWFWLQTKATKLLFEKRPKQFGVGGSAAT